MENNTPMIKLSQDVLVPTTLRGMYGNEFMNSMMQSRAYGKNEIGRLDIPNANEMSKMLKKDKSATAVRLVEWIDSKSSKVEWRYVVYGKNEDGKTVDDRNSYRVYALGENGEWVQEFSNIEDKSKPKYEKAARSISDSVREAISRSEDEVYTRTLGEDFVDRLNTSGSLTRQEADTMPIAEGLGNHLPLNGVVEIRVVENFDVKSPNSRLSTAAEILEKHYSMELQQAFAGSDVIDTTSLTPDQVKDMRNFEVIKRKIGIEDNEVRYVCYKDSGANDLDAYILTETIDINGKSKKLMRVVTPGSDERGNEIFAVNRFLVKEADEPETVHYDKLFVVTQQLDQDTLLKRVMTKEGDKFINLDIQIQRGGNTFLGFSTLSPEFDGIDSVTRSDKRTGSFADTEEANLPQLTLEKLAPSVSLDLIDTEIVYVTPPSFTDRIRGLASRFKQERESIADALVDSGILEDPDHKGPDSVLDQFLTKVRQVARLNVAQNSEHDLGDEPLTAKGQYLWEREGGQYYKMVKIEVQNLGDPVEGCILFYYDGKHMIRELVDSAGRLADPNDTELFMEIDSFMHAHEEITTVIDQLQTLGTIEITEVSLDSADFIDTKDQWRMTITPTNNKPEKVYHYVFDDNDSSLRSYFSTKKNGIDVVRWEKGVLLGNYTREEAEKKVEEEKERVMNERSFWADGPRHQSVEIESSNRFMPKIYSDEEAEMLTKLIITKTTQQAGKME